MNQYTYTLTRDNRTTEARCTAKNATVARWHLVNAYTGHDVGQQPVSIDEPHRVFGELDASTEAHADMVDSAHRQAARNMIARGGSFAGSIGEAFLVADSHNGPRLMAAFPELFDRYATN